MMPKSRELPAIDVHGHYGQYVQPETPALKRGIPFPASAGGSHFVSQSCGRVRE